jgi:glycosyltransferase involved in cell wall biosynthesis
MTGSESERRQPATRPSRDLRVLCVVNRIADNGGAEVSTVQLIRRLQGRGFRFGLATLRGTHGSRFEGELARAGVAIWKCRVPTWPGRVRFVHQVATSFRPDVVHSALPESDLLARPIARLRRVPHLSSIVNASYSQDARLANASSWRLDVWRMVDGWTARHASTAFHALTNAVADEAVASLKIRRERITVIPRGRDVETLGRRSTDRRRAVRGRLGIADEEPLLVNVARQVPQKGQVHLIRAFAAVQRRHPNARLLIAGRAGNASAEIARAIAEHDLVESVRLLGVYDEVGELLAAADVFVFSSLYEGFGGAVVEAMALGVPVVAFDIPAVREVVADTGCLVPAGDAGAMAAAISKVIENPDVASELGTRGTARFERFFTIEMVADAMAQLYREVAGSGR